MGEQTRDMWRVTLDINGGEYTLTIHILALRCEQIPATDLTLLVDNAILVFDSPLLVMTVNTSRKGARNEHRTMALLEAAGYRCTRSGASLGAWDIVAISSQDILLVQVKTRDWPGKAETEQLELFPCPVNCRKIVHRWRSGKRLPDVKEL